MSENPIPYGYCQCGCGQRTTIAKQSNSARGHVRGQPMRFISGHNSKQPLATRFWKYVAVGTPNECWLWQGYTNPAGYGGIHVGGRDGSCKLAHRVSWELHYGPIPEGLFVCHHCDTPACVNPNHLFAGTHTDNVRDMHSKGRYRFQKVMGANHPNSKLTDEQVRQIRSLYAQGGTTMREIGQRFGVTRSSIGIIVRRKTWRHVY